MSEAERAIREALPFATPGRWEHVFANGGREHYVYAPDAHYRRDLPGPVKVAWLPYSPGSNRDVNDAIYIAACNPENIAALLAEIDRLTRELDEARAEHDEVRAERDTLKIGIDSVLHALARADVSDVDDPGDAIDLLAADAKRYDYILDCEFIAARKYLPNLDEHEFKAKRIAHHDAQIEQERSEKAREGA